MSDDLISRKALIDEIERSMNFNPHEDSKIALNHRNEHIHFLSIVEKIPIAYDIDLVCDEIHKVFHEELDAIFEKSDGEVIAEKIDWILKMNKKINEIVRNGGNGGKNDRKAI